MNQRGIYEKSEQKVIVRSAHSHFLNSFISLRTGRHKREREDYDVISKSKGWLETDVEQKGFMSPEPTNLETILKLREI